jgi:hypothetical protein
VRHTSSLVARTLLAHPPCNSWYNCGNVFGKKRIYAGYTGFKLA